MALDRGLRRAARAVLVSLLLAFALAALSPRSAVAAACRSARPPGAHQAWRAAPIRPASVFAGIPGNGARRIGSVGGAGVSWLLVLRTATARGGGCWVRLRLPGRPNDAAGWVAGRRLLLTRTRWRLDVSRAERTLTVLRGGRVVRRFPVVVGAPDTPTPAGLFSIVHAWRSDPASFVGSWVLGLTAHSDVLRHFEGGSGEVGIHGRGGESLVDPLGTAASHGCIRLANGAIDWLVRTIGRRRLPGIPVSIIG